LPYLRKLLASLADLNRLGLLFTDRLPVVAPFFNIVIFAPDQWSSYLLLFAPGYEKDVA